MDIFISNIPLHSTEDQLKSLIAPFLNAVGIYQFKLESFTTREGKRHANLTVPSARAAEEFLTYHGPRPGLRLNSIPQPIRIGILPITFKRAHSSSDPFVLRRLRAAEARHLPSASAQQPGQPKNVAVKSLECGFFDYRDREDGQLIFYRCYQSSRRGSLVVGRKKLLVLLDADESTSARTRILVEYSSIQTLFHGTDKRPNITLTLRHPPTFYEDRPSINVEDIGNSLNQLSILDSAASKLSEKETYRVCHLRESHAAAAGASLTYIVNLETASDLTNAIKRLRQERGAPNPTSVRKPVSTHEFNFQREMTKLTNKLGEDTTLPFTVKFQLQMLASNGILNPRKVAKLQDRMVIMLQELDPIRVAEGIRSLARTLPFVGPGMSSKIFSLDSITSLIKEKASSFSLKNSMYRIVRRHDHLALIYKACVSPAGLWLEGPELETQNRVLRKYPQSLDFFLRVNFCDENGEQVRFEYKVSRDAIFQGRFKNVLSEGLLIAGRKFGFLGFSHSSLRNQTCWFLAPFYVDKSLLMAKNLIQDLGDFSKIFSPAKCAARIGQAFSDATDSVDIRGSTLEYIDDIERNGRCFSDGVGTISFSLLRKVWKRFSKNRKAHAPVLQMRLQGCKGLLVLDTTIKDSVIRIRPSMEKFQSPNHMHLEITGAAYRPLPMYLNRQFINVLEGLGANTEAFMELQQKALAEIKKMTESPLNAATYLEASLSGTAVGLPALLRSLYYAGFGFKNDTFLNQAVEVVTRVQLRELKHKARIPVSDAHTLYGIVDETGFLKPDEIHVIMKEKNGDVTERTGRALVTRAPAMHPGDIQFVNAVQVPPGSQNEHLHNCVIFSQLGTRDIPSMLSGGDLDGDLFNVIFEPSLFPPRTYPPADYPRLTAVNIGRPVETRDMSDFFLTFMEQDKLGFICTSHLIIADQKADNVLNENCIKVAGMASTAVDFSKTGIPVDMAEFPHKSYDKRRRPDFMANAPHLILDPDQGTLELDEDELDFHDVPDDIDDVLADGSRATRYYESQRILGKLYRNIDETEFVKSMQRTNKSPNGNATDLQRSSGTFLNDLWTFVSKSARFVEWDTFENRALALDIRDYYEERLVDIMYQFSPHPRQPLSELEVFCGTILGREGGMPSKRTRESNMDMKDSFNRHAREIIQRIKKGIGFDEDENENENENGEESRNETAWDEASVANSALTFEEDSNTETLGRSIACLSVAIHEEGVRYDRQIGQLRSFAYLAAGICLKHLSQYEEMKRQRQRQERTALGGMNSTRSGRAVYSRRRHPN